MYEQLDVQDVHIGIYNRLAGNMDARFDEAAVVNRRRHSLIDTVSPAKIAAIDAQGKDRILDLRNVSLKDNWNELTCDGLITSDASAALVLMPADCIPLVIYSTKTRMLGLIHVGRRGASLGIHQKSVAYICQVYKEDVGDLRFYLGPSIHQKSYYFNKIDAEQLHDPAWEPFIKHTDNFFHIDLIGFTVQGLKDLHIPERHIVISAVDTGSDGGYFSHVRSRRTGEPEGRNTIVAYRRL